MSGDKKGEAIPRPLSEGTVPLISIEGAARDCGRQYAELVLEKYPGYRRYLDEVQSWQNISGQTKRLMEDRAPYLLDLHQGLYEVAGPPQEKPQASAQESCTSFGVRGSLTLDGEPISGQTKDTVPESAELYIVLRMRIEEGPTILVLTYPGEIMGYGFWSTGMSLFRNSLHSAGPCEKGLSSVEWGLLALAGQSVEQATELAREYGIAGTGNFLITDRQGQSVSVEHNVGGVSVIESQDGISTHANHPLGKETAPFEHYPDKVRQKDSRHRMERLRELLAGERGRLTAQKCMTFLADHGCYPWGICAHLLKERTPLRCTTAAVVVEPAKGKLHVTRGNPCSNWPVTYSI